MKAFAYGIAAALLFAACGGGGTGQASPTAVAATVAPTATPATTAVFTADLKSSEEVPPVTGPEASCAGTGTVTLDKVAYTAKFDITVSGCPATTELTAAHIHKGARGIAASPVTPSVIAAGEVTLSAGGATISKALSAALAASLVADIIANPSGFYLNVHSKANGGGVIRSQLTARP